jgi:hypothetical protein
MSIAQISDACAHVIVTSAFQDKEAADPANYKYLFHIKFSRKQTHGAYKK